MLQRLMLLAVLGKGQKREAGRTPQEKIVSGWSPGFVVVVTNQGRHFKLPSHGCRRQQPRCQRAYHRLIHCPCHSEAMIPLLTAPTCGDAVKSPEERTQRPPLLMRDAVVDTGGSRDGYKAGAAEAGRMPQFRDVPRRCRTFIPHEFSYLHV